jgi:hypothetical protein
MNVRSGCIGLPFSATRWLGLRVAIKQEPPKRPGKANLGSKKPSNT